MTQARMLRAGATRALLDGPDLRYIRTDGGPEAVRRVYVGVRDRTWDTIPGVVSDLAVDQRREEFEVTFTCRHARRDIDYRWEGSIVGAADGAIAYRMDGRAQSDFAYSRIGFCVLHPFRTAKGARYRATTPSGPVEGEIPDLVGPQGFEDGRYVALTPAVSALAVDLPGGGAARLTFEGDLFEMEDQRNWTDASLKTYCTPLGRGDPLHAERGQEIRQVVHIAVDGRPAPGGRTVDELVVGEALGVRPAAVGLGAPTDPAPLSQRQIRLLRAVAPAHLRADVHIADDGHREHLRRVIGACAELGCPLELAVYMLESDAPALTAVARALDGAPLARVLVFAADATSPSPRETTPAGLVALAREGLRVPPGVPVGGGTDMDFCELNRTRPAPGTMDVVAWSVNPQVHASDDRSIMETPPAQAETVRTARSFAGGAQLAVTPITLRPRFNAAALGAEDPPPAGELPGPVDPRQAGCFTAAWTVASLGALLRAGVASATYFEPSGWRGLLESEQGPPLPDRFPSRPGQTFPVYHVLADLAGRAGDEQLAVRASDELRLAGLALRGPAGTRLLVANLTTEDVAARLAGLPGARASIRLLDGASEELAGADPAAFRERAQPAALRDGTLDVALGPYAVATVDVV